MKKDENIFDRHIQFEDLKKYLKKMKEKKIMDKVEYTDSDYQELESALMRARSVAHGRPDQFQFYQNELSHAIAYFLLLPYRMSKKDE